MIRLEEGDVEGRMDAHRRWQIQPEGTRADRLDDGEGTEAFGIQFVRGTFSSDVAPKEPDLVSYFEVRSRGAMDIGVLRVRLESLGDGLSSNLVDVLKVLDMLVGCWNAGASEGDFETGVVAKVGKERSHADRRVIGIVVGELGERKKVVPIILEIVAVSTEILFQGLVDSLGLAVGFWMEGCGKVWLDLEHAL